MRQAIGATKGCSISSAVGSFDMGSPNHGEGAAADFVGRVSMGQVLAQPSSDLLLWQPGGGGMPEFPHQQAQGHNALVA